MPCCAVRFCSVPCCAVVWSFGQLRTSALETYYYGTQFASPCLPFPCVASCRLVLCRVLLRCMQPALFPTFAVSIWDLSARIQAPNSASPLKFLLSTMDATKPLLKSSSIVSFSSSRNEIQAARVPNPLPCLDPIMPPLFPLFSAPLLLGCRFELPGPRGKIQHEY
jgi:hypothetical protein